jgi:hypothetical protein
MEYLAKALDHGRMDCWALSNKVGEMFLCNVKKVVWFEVCVVNNILLDKVTKAVVLFVGPAGHFVTSPAEKEATYYMGVNIQSDR